MGLSGQTAGEKRECGGSFTRGPRSAPPPSPRCETIRRFLTIVATCHIIPSPPPSAHSYASSMLSLIILLDPECATSLQGDLCIITLILK